MAFGIDNLYMRDKDGEINNLKHVLPVHIPVACSSNPRTQVFPLPGKLTRATGALFVPFMK